MTRRSLVAMVCSTIWLAGCSGDPRSAEGFSLPDGDVERGAALFDSYGCPSCHAVAGSDSAGSALVELGGRVTRVKTYGELVSAVINPSHRLPPGYPIARVSRAGESLMTVYNDVMTVSELIDLVAYLQSTYQVVRPRVAYGPYSYERWEAERAK